MEKNKTSPCSGGPRVSDKALLAMLGPPKFNKKSVVSDEDLFNSELKSVIRDSGGDLGVASGKTGITRSSIKRRLSASPEAPIPYDQTNPSGQTRKYLERTIEKWRVVGFDTYTGNACLEMSGAVPVRISVRVGITRG